MKKCSKCGETKQEFFDWCKKQKLKINIMLKQGKFVRGLMPSVDRVDNDGHYEFSNMQIITMVENNRKK